MNDSYWPTTELHRSVTLASDVYRHKYSLSDQGLSKSDSAVGIDLHQNQSRILTYNLLLTTTWHLQTSVLTMTAVQSPIIITGNLYVKKFNAFILTSLLTVISSNIAWGEELYLICTIPLLNYSHHLVVDIDTNSNTSSIKQYNIKVGASLYSSDQVPFFANKGTCPNPTWDTVINEMIIQVSTACAEGDDEEYLVEISRATGSIDHYFAGTHIGRGRCVKASDRAF